MTHSNQVDDSVGNRAGERASLSQTIEIERQRIVWTISAMETTGTVEGLEALARVLAETDVADFAARVWKLAREKRR